MSAGQLALVGGVLFTGPARCSSDLCRRALLCHLCGGARLRLVRGDRALLVRQLDRSFVRRGALRLRESSVVLERQ
jgi:hypothetical protein